MKTLRFLIVLVISSFCLTNCFLWDNSPVDNTVVTEAFAVPPSIAYGGNTTIYWNCKNVTSVTKNGVSVPISGSENIRSVTKDTLVSFVFKGIDGKQTTRLVSISVGAKPSPTRTDTLCGRYWMLIEEKVLVNNVWTKTKLDDDQLRSKGYYYPDGSSKFIDPLTGETETSNWNWVGKDSINFNGVKGQYKLTDTLFILSERNGTIITTCKGFKL